MNTLIFACVVFSAIVGTSGFIHERLFPEDVAEMFADKSERRLRLRRAVNQALHARQRRSAAAQVTGDIEVFTDLDGDNDGFITVPEYREFNTREINDDVTAIFRRYDKDSDSKISKAEFFGFLDDINVSSMSSADIDIETPILSEDVVLSSSSSMASSSGGLFESETETESSVPSEDCELEAMKKCDARFFEVLDLLITDEDAFCKGYQAYVECVFEDIVPCNMYEYVENVINVGNIYKDLDICPDLDFTSLETYDDDTLERSRRSPTKAHTNKRGHIKNERHLKNAVSPCNVHFVRSSQYKDTDFCAALTQYRHCVLRGIRPYRSESVNHLRDGLKFMTREHRRTHVCAGND